MALTKIQAAGLTADLIDETKLADNSIDSEHYNDGSIDNAHLADDAVGIAELSASGTASSSTFLRGDNSWATPAGKTTEEVQDIVGAMFTGNTETNITATYEDSDGTIDLVATDTNTQLSTEEVQDIVGAMFTGNTETNITATYQDSDGTIDLVVGTSGAALTGSTNNTICTVTGADAIQGEANLTFDGSTLEVKASAATANDLINAVNVNARTTGTAAAGVGTKMTFYGSMTGQDDVELGQIGFHNTNVSGAHGDFIVKTRPNGTSQERLRITSGGNLGIGTSPSYLTHIKKDTSGGAVGTKVVIENAATDSVNNNVELYLKTSAGDFGFKHYNATESYIQVPDQLIINTNTANSAAQALHIDTSQNVKVSNGNLVIGTAGKGISFAATSDGTTMSSELLDDYEEGTYNPTWSNVTNVSNYNEWNYVKIGKVVHIQGWFKCNTTTNSGSSHVTCTVPFTSQTNPSNGYASFVGPIMHENMNTYSSGNFVTYLSDNSNLVYFYRCQQNGAWATLRSDDVTADDMMIINFTYMV